MADRRLSGLVAFPGGHLAVVVLVSCALTSADPAAAAPPRGGGQQDARQATDARHARDMRLFETYQGMLDEDPYQPYALRRLLEVSHVRGGITGLVALYEARVAEDAASVNDWVILGHLYGAGDRHADADRAFGTATTLAPRAWRPHRDRARLQRKSQHWEAALTAFDSALDRARGKEDRIALWQEAADTALEGKLLARGQGYFAAMFTAEPRKPFLQMEAAATLARRGYPRAALDAWLAVKDRVRGTLKHLVVVWRQVATLQEELGELADAESTWRNGLRALPSGHWARPEFLEGLVGVYRRRDALPALVEELETGRVSDRATQLVLAHLHEEMGRDDRAKAWLERALAKNPRDVATRLRLIGILERVGPAKALIAQHERLIKLSRGEPRHELNLVALYFQKGMTQKGFKLLDRITRRYRSDPGVHQRVVDLTMRYGGDAERPRIERAYRTLMRLEPREEGHVISLGEYWWSSGDRAKARQTWARLRTMGKPSGAAGHLAHAEVLSDHGLVTEAREAFEAALAAEPDNTRAARAYALFLEQQKLSKEALEVWQRILGAEQSAAKTTEARRHMVQLWQKVGRSNRQEARLRGRFNATPPDLDAGFLLVEFLLDRRAFDEAQSTLERLRTLAPDRVETLAALERLYTRKDQLDKAIEVLEQLARLDPREAYHYLHRAADLALARGDLDTALKTTRRVVALNPADPSAHDRVGDLYRRMGRMSEAATAWRQVLVLNPRNDTVRFKLADLYRGLGQPDRERQELIHVVREAVQPADALKAGRRLLQVAIATRGLRDVEDAIRPLAVQRAGRSDVYLKLLIDVYVASARAIRWAHQARHTTAERRRLLRELGDRALRALLEALGGSDVALRARALEVTQSTRPPGAVPALARLLSTPGTVARVAVAGALGAIGTRSAAEALTRLYDTGSGDTQRIAIWALGLSSAPEALDTLLTCASSRHTHHRVLAAWAMGRRADPRAIDALRTLARSADSRQRLAAVWALTQMPGPEVTTTLGQALRSSESVERQVASRGLALVGTAAAHRLLIQRLWTPNEQPIGHLGEALTSAADGTDRATVVAAYAALSNPGRGRLKEDTGPLLAATSLTPPTSAQRFAATESLMPMLKARLKTILRDGHPRSVERVLEACLEPDGALRLAPLLPETERDPTRTRALVSTLWSDASGALLELAQGSLGTTIQVDALRLLRQVHIEHDGGATSPEPSGLRAVLAVAREALDSPWPEIQAAAVSLLTRDELTPRGAALEPLLARLQTWATSGKHAPSVRMAVARALGHLGRDVPDRTGTTRALRRLLVDRSTAVRLAAIEAAATLDDEALLEPLIDRASDPVADVARAAIRALEGSGQPRAQILLRTIHGTHAWSPAPPGAVLDSPRPP